MNGVRGVSWPSATLVTALLLAATLAPLLFVPIPAMVDYVNHLARMALLAGPGPYQGYVVHWSLTPNLAMDVIVPTLARIMPVDVAARLFLALTYALVVSGAMAVERAVKGRHLIAGLCAVPVLFSVPFAWGLGNFNFGLGLALWGVAVWIGSAGWPLLRRWGLHCGVVAVLFLAHFLALGFYGVVIGLVEFPPLLLRRSWRQALVLTLALASPVGVLLALMTGLGGAMGGQGMDWDWAQKLQWPLLFLNGNDPQLAILSAMAVMLLLAWMVGRHQLHLTSQGRWVAAGLLLLYLAMPRRLFDIAFVDVRVLALAALVLPAFVTHTVSRAGAVVLVVLALINGAATTSAWVARQGDYRAFRASFAQLQPGTAVLIAVAPDAARSDIPLYYAPTLAAAPRDVFVASLYAFGGAQPVAPAPRFAGLAVAQALDYLPVPLTDLFAGTPPPHAHDWQHQYHYLYVIGPPQAAPLPGVLTEVAAGARFRLYRITPAFDTAH